MPTEQHVARGVQGAQPDLDRLREHLALRAARTRARKTSRACCARSRPTITPIQKKNRDRSTRLDKMLDSEIAQLQTDTAAPAPTTPAAAPSGAAAAPDEAKQQQVAARAIAARQTVADQATSDVDKSLPLLEALAAEPPPHGGSGGRHARDRRGRARITAHSVASPDSAARSSGPTPRSR